MAVSTIKHNVRIETDTFSFKVSAGGWSQKYVGFKQAFAEPPLISVYQSGNEAYPLALRVTGITENGFYVYARDSTAATLTMIYQAIGY